MTGPGTLRGLDAGRARLMNGAADRWHELPPPVRWLAAAAGIALAAALPVLNPPLITTEPGSDFATTMFTVAVTVLAALGLNVVVGQAGLLDLGYVGFYAVGAYTVAVFGSPASALATRYPFLVCVPIAIALSMLAGVVLGAPTLRVRGDYLAIVTLGFGEIVRLTLVNSEALGAAAGISGVPRPPGRHDDGRPLFGILDATPFYWLVLAVILGVVAVTGMLSRSRVGRAWLSIREDEDVAELMGVPTFRFKLWAFAVGAAVGGLSGTLFASKQAFINPQSFPILTSVLFLAAVVVGGAGNTLGVVAGAVLIAYLPERFRFLAEYRVLAFGLALIVMSVFRPQGLVPGTRRARSRPAAVDEDAVHDPTLGMRRAHHDLDPAAPLLEVDGVTLRFGGVTALDGVRFAIGHGEILGLIGPNGAGKTTCFNVITGLYRPDSGQVRLGGRPIDRLKKYEITRRGVARTFQSIRLFPEMTALENVRVGADARHRSSVPGVLLRAVRYPRRPEEFGGPHRWRSLQRLAGISRHAREERSGHGRAMQLLEFVGIADRAHETARNLPYGYQRRLEIARALATEPVLLCLDEPAAGSNPAEKAELLALIRRVRDAGYTVLLIEHDMRLVMGVTDRIVVLDLGRTIADGTPAQIRDDAAVVAAYLGVPDDDDEEAAS